MHTYIHTCMHACMHAYIHTHIHTYMHTYRYVDIHKHMPACTHCTDNIICRKALLSLLRVTCSHVDLVFPGFITICLQGSPTSDLSLLSPGRAAGFSFGPKPVPCFSGLLHAHAASLFYKPDMTRRIRRQQKDHLKLFQNWNPGP